MTEKWLTTECSVENEHLVNLKRELDQIEKNNRTLGVTVRQRREAVERHRREAQELRLQVQTAEDEVNRLQDELEEDTPQTGLLEALEGQLAEAKDSAQTHTHAYDDCTEARAKIDAKQKELKPKMDQALLQVKEVEARIAKADKKATEASDARERILRRKNEAYAHADDLKRQRQEAEEKREAQKAEVEDYESKASRYCARVAVDPGSTWQSLEKKINALHEQQARQERQYVFNILCMCDVIQSLMKFN
jgi:structural maintenance of chromosomes protein 6